MIKILKLSESNIKKPLHLLTVAVFLCFTLYPGRDSNP